MKPIIWNLVNWCVLAVIVWATYRQMPASGRLLEIATIWVWIVNLLIILYLAGMFAFREVRNLWQEERQKRSTWRRIYYWSSILINLAVFALAGWLWTFGIRLAQIVILEIIVGERKPSQ